MFYNCSKLTSIILPVSVTSIGSNTFQNTGLSGINIPTNLNSIGSQAFYGCSNLKTVTVEDKTDALIFNGSTNNHFSYSPIETLYLGRNISTSFSQNRVPFSGNVVLKMVTIGNDVTAINADSFNGCTGLLTLTFGDGLNTIGDNAFYGCSSLTGVLLPAVFAVPLAELLDRAPTYGRLLPFRMMRLPVQT
jgi:hypothetical protein